jgi:hypothetical protein
MGSVFYAKRYNDTTFFDELATKKTSNNNYSILVQSLKNNLDTAIVNS